MQNSFLLSLGRLAHSSTSACLNLKHRPKMATKHAGNREAGVQATEIPTDYLKPAMSNNYGGRGDVTQPIRSMPSC